MSAADAPRPTPRAGCASCGHAWDAHVDGMCFAGLPKGVYSRIDVTCPCVETAPRVPPASAPAATPERRFRCTACGGEFDEIEVTCPAGQYHCGPCVPIIEHPPAATPEPVRFSTPACPEHGDACIGAECCCADKHPPAVREREFLARVADPWGWDDAQVEDAVSFAQMFLRERDEARAALTTQATELAALRARVATAKSALENWGRHHHWCEYLRPIPDGKIALPCSCGYEQAVRDASPESFMTKEWCLAAAKDEAEAEARLAALAPRQTTGDEHG